MTLTPPPAMVGLLAVALGLAALATAGLPAFYEAFLYTLFSWIALATSWAILSGYAGYFSFGHGAFFGAGIYTTATLTTAHDVPFLATLVAAGAVAALMATGIGAVVFRVRRLRGELFGLLTLAVTFVVATIVLNTRIDGGPGVYLSAVPLPRLFASPTGTFYALGLALALVTVAGAYLIARSRLGLGLYAIHDDEDVAEVAGVPTYAYKLMAFALSAGVAGVAGGIHAMYVTYVTVGETFSITVPLYVVLMSILGGARHWLGPAVGATIIGSSLYAFTGGDLAVLGRALVAFVLILVILLLPEGVVPTLLRRWRTWRRRVPLPAAAASATSVLVGHASLAPAAMTAARAAPRRGGEHPADGLADSAPAHTSAGGADIAVGRGADAGASALVCRDVWKAFGGIQALRGVTLEVRPGEILGLVGPNGSGKTTLINVISGHYELDRGRITLGDTILSGQPGHAVRRIGVSRTYQIPRPFAHLTAAENVAVSATFGAARLGLGDAGREARRWLEFAGLARRADALPDELNLHERKFLELARALAARPRVILLDEVLSGLNPPEIAGAIQLIQEIRARGVAILFVEHLMRAVLELSDRVVVLNEGEVIAAGVPHEAMQSERVVEVYLGKAHVVA